MFDVTDRSTFDELSGRFLHNVMEVCPEACKLLVGNKSMSFIEVY